MQVRILGCGTSSGVPRVGNDWGECDPGDPRNRRRRASILVNQGEGRILVDTSPDLREQLLDAEVDDITALLWTHDHADHIHGIDDLRQLFHARGAPVQGFARPDTMDTLRSRFSYAFEGKGDYPPIVSGKPLTDRMEIGEIAVRIVDQPHGEITSAGIRFEAAGKSIAYSTDFNILTDEMVEVFRNVDLWIVDALRRRPHPSHSHLAQTLEWIDIVNPKRAVLTHMDQSMDYETLLGELPAKVVPGHDGLEIRV